MTVLLVEDEANIASFVTLELEHEGYTVITAAGGREALALFETAQAEGNCPDIILLDIMLPELNGLEVLRRIRKISGVPVILVTARGETLDKVNGLDSGADDYISKPFAIEELLARIRSVLRRKQQETAAQTAVQASQPLAPLRFEDLELDSVRMEVHMRGSEITLTRTEFLLLQCLMQHKNEVLSRDKIIELVWGAEHYIDENSVDVYVRYLRAKIDDLFGVKYITTVRGTGYTMKELKA